MCARCSLTLYFETTADFLARYLTLSLNKTNDHFAINATIYVDCGNQGEHLSGDFGGSLHTLLEVYNYPP